MSEHRTSDNDLDERLRGALHEIGDDAIRCLDVKTSSKGHPAPQNGGRRSMAPLLAAAAVAAFIGGAAASPRLFDGQHDRHPVNEEPVVSSSESSSAPARSDIRSAVDRISARVTRLWREPGYGKVTVDYQTATVSVYWHGDPPSEIEQLRDRTIDGVEIEVVEAQYSDSDMAAAARRVLKHDQTSGGSFEVSHAFPTKDLSALVVVILRTGAPLDSLDAGALERSLAKVAGVPVVVKFTADEFVDGAMPFRNGGHG